MNKAGAAGIVLLAGCALVAGCASLSSGGPQASAYLQPTRGNSVSGTVSFTQTGDKLRMVAEVSGLRPGSEHGFHIHEVGDCSSGDGMSAKGHFNPYGKAHAHYMSAEHHAGDLPPLKADDQGRAKLDVDLDGLSVAPGPASIVGRGLIVHADPDDFKTQPTGNSGARIACAVIVVAGRPASY
jgi:Cu-Zn family superoxide dismutase